MISNVHLMMQGLKHRQKVKSPQEEEETKFPLAFHAEGKNSPLEMIL